MKPVCLLLIFIISLTFCVACSTSSDRRYPTPKTETSTETPTAAVLNEVPSEIAMANSPAPEPVENAKQTIVQLLSQSHYGRVNYENFYIDNTMFRYEEKVKGVGNFQWTMPFLEIKSFEPRFIPDAIVGQKYSLDIELYQLENLARLFVDSRRELNLLFNAFDTMIGYASQWHDG